MLLMGNVNLVESEVDVSVFGLRRRKTPLTSFSTVCSTSSCFFISQISNLHIVSGGDDYLAHVLCLFLLLFLHLTHLLSMLHVDPYRVNHQRATAMPPRTDPSSEPNDFGPSYDIKHMPFQSWSWKPT